MQLSLRELMSPCAPPAGNVTLMNTTTFKTAAGALPRRSRYDLAVFDVVATATDNLGVVTTLGVTSGAAPPFLVM